MPILPLRLAPLVLVATVALSGTATASVLVTVNKATQRMTVLVDGETRYSWPVSTGMKGYATPAGTFRPFRLEEEHYSKEWDDAPMPHSIFFTPAGHAIHGSNATRHLGSPASHGCIRIAPANAAKLFALVSAEGLTNTKVVVTGGQVSRVAKRQTRYARPPRLRPELVNARPAAVLLFAASLGRAFTSASPSPLAGRFPRESRRRTAIMRPPGSPHRRRRRPA